MQTEIINIKPLDIMPAPSPGYVLIVDDEEQNRSLLHDPLEARGYEIAEAENGMVALEKIAARLPDVILLDVMMPQMDGFEVCRRLKTDSKTAHIPILMVTALSERKERLMGIAVGANDFLNKPVDIQDVTLRVGNAVYTKHLHDQLQAEQEKSEQLLLNILPKLVAERMKKGETNIADSFPDVTVLVADLVGFWKKSRPSAMPTWSPAAFLFRDLITPRPAPNSRSKCRRKSRGSTTSMTRPFAYASAFAPARSSRASSDANGLPTIFGAKRSISPAVWKPPVKRAKSKSPNPLTNG